MLEHLYKVAEEYNADISICGKRNVDGRLVSSIEFDEPGVDKAGAEELLKREKYTVAPHKAVQKKLVYNIRFISMCWLTIYGYIRFLKCDIVVAQETAVSGSMMTV